ncbi:MAG: hypothetical protein UR18_C0006G0029 [Candidatus Nomurabacteria bacterium GW2011_GWE2_31_40]|nr:MAG: hypothetical protein UR18_C0006G0029 [Candidatus Nomurabacteria bacterium GW2011_GWE2_31_40]OGV06195.1 MAG: hypothetical protein A2299_12215 [Stygiobacter sp. RIFOXYB2_FULL_37_11]OGV15945.1 MAG: hypothetical protein A2440_03145 [Stygiobacter sp. RIFOXYC2_FULL_38_25]OGV27889.1 MAG: hypothetical protein A2499_17250 [Stygiobacter sp. RIFOXYC12_FULL_38_8]OGV80422.1 MAG: hypothetical protein A2X65_04305 [Stygiobacter sp. GWF2_38_21]
MNQNQQILNYMLEGNKITPLEALQKFNCLRLGARIWDLEKEYPALKIKHDLIEVESGKHVAEYSIEDLTLLLRSKTCK